VHKTKGQILEQSENLEWCFAVNVYLTRTLFPRIVVHPLNRCMYHYPEDIAHHVMGTKLNAARKQQSTFWTSTKRKFSNPVNLTGTMDIPSVHDLEGIYPNYLFLGSTDRNNHYCDPSGSFPMLWHTVYSVDSHNSVYSIIRNSRCMHQYADRNFFKSFQTSKKSV